MAISGQRFRANGYHTMCCWALVLRTIVTEVPNIDQLGLPQTAHNVLKEKRVWCWGPDRPARGNRPRWPR
jgi:twitching motility protein PilT